MTAKAQRLGVLLLIFISVSSYYWIKYAVRKSTRWNVIYDGKIINESDNGTIGGIKTGSPNGSFNGRYWSGRASFVELPPDPSKSKNDIVAREIAIIGDLGETADHPFIWVALDPKDHTHMFVNLGHDNDSRVSYSKIALLEYANFGMKLIATHLLDCPSTNNLAQIEFTSEGLLSIHSENANCVYDPQKRKIIDTTKHSLESNDSLNELGQCYTFEQETIWGKSTEPIELDEGCSFGLDRERGVFGWMHSNGGASDLISFRPTAPNLGSKSEERRSNIRWLTRERKRWFAICNVDLTPNYLTYTEEATYNGTTRRQRFVLFKKPIDIRMGCRS